ncbi:MAG: hypothetical protein HQL66_09565 [Magnetococcales bacterium]|nr:hypothetical protein [Magnetococcales bacterium]
MNFQYDHTRSDIMRTGIRDLVLANDVSVRLRNCIANNDDLPFETVGAYVQAGTQGILKMLSVPNLGKKTALELDALVKLYVESGKVLPGNDTENDEPLPRMARDQGRDNILRLLRNVPLQAALMHTGVEERVRKGVDSLGDVWSIGEFVERYQEIHTRLLKQVNFGRGSLKKLEEMIEQIIHLRVRQVTGDAQLAGAVTLQELIGSDVTAGALHCFGDMTFSYDSEEHVDLYALFSESSGHRNASEQALKVVHALSAKEKDVILRRYGLDGFAPHALEDVAREFFVTRERVRQVESGAIKRLGVPRNAALFRNLLDSETMNLWSNLSDDTGFIPVEGMDTEAIRSNGLLRLALDVVHDGVHGWLKATGRPVLGGWLRNDIPAGEFKSDVRLMAELASEGLFPMPVEQAGKKTGMDVHRVRRAIRLVSELRYFDGHLVKGHLGAQAKRTIRLYRMLLEFRSRRLVDFRIHLTEYSQRFPEDVCILRIAELTMERTPHFFKKVFDNFWFAVPLPEIPMEESESSVLDDVPILYADPQDEDDPGTDAMGVKQWLTNLLDARGPMRFYDIKTEGLASLPEGISINSLGPVLLTAGEFMRLAPGVYGLPKHLTSIRNTGTRYPSSMMTEEQCRWYAMARKAGEPMSLFPAWDFRFERALCYLAMGHCSSELYGSLLAVSDPSRWDCPPDELEKWRWLKKQHGRYQLDVPCRHPLDPGKVTPDQLLSALLLMRSTGSLSWISFNRAGLSRIDSHKCAAGLALLIAMGAIQPATHWQDRHLPGPEAGRILEILSGELASKGNLSWKSGGARELLISASATIPMSGKGWVDGGEYKEFMDRLLDDHSKDGEENDTGESDLDGIIGEQGWAQEWENEEPPGNNAPQADSGDDLFLGDDWGKQWQE